MSDPRFTQDVLDEDDSLPEVLCPDCGEPCDLEGECFTCGK